MTQETGRQPDGCRAESLTGPARQVHHPRTAVVFAGSAGDACRPAAERFCGYINFFASHRAARAWACRHPEVTGRLLTRDGALRTGVAEFSSCCRPLPGPARRQPRARNNQ